MKTESQQPKWRAVEISDGQFVVENGERSRTLSGQHCRCCALAAMIQEHGGTAGLRGLHGYGACYRFLVVIQRGGNVNED